jgi:hypothetical protein
MSTYPHPTEKRLIQYGQNADILNMNMDIKVSTLPLVVGHLVFSLLGMTDEHNGKKSDAGHSTSSPLLHVL